MSHSSFATKSKYRKIGWLERASESVGRLVAPGRLRTGLRASYHQIMMLRSGGRGLRCDLPDGESVRVLPGYRFAAWNAAECQAFRAAVRPGGVALDIGANIGAYSLLLGRWVGQQGKVFAFEPAPETFAALNRHVHMNRLEGIVLPQHRAISDRAGTLDFVADGFQGTNRLLADNETTVPSSGSTQVQTVTIDEFCSKNSVRPTFIKIDIEGFELAALRGARETLRHGRGQLALFVEMHPTTWKQIGVSREDVIAELDAQDLRAEPLVPEGKPWEIEGVCMRVVSKTVPLT